MLVVQYLSATCNRHLLTAARRFACRVRVARLHLVLATNNNSKNLPHSNNLIGQTKRETDRQSIVWDAMESVGCQLPEKVLQDIDSASGEPGKRFTGVYPKVLFVVAHVVLASPFCTVR